MAIRIRRAKDHEIDEITELDRKILAASNPYPDTEFWGAWEGEELVGYAGCRLPAEWPGYCFMSRSGVIERCRGQGLQKRLIRVRRAFAKKSGCKSVLTYTMPDNAASMNSLISCGFKTYDPENPYLGEAKVVYCRLTL